MKHAESGIRGAAESRVALLMRRDGAERLPAVYLIDFCRVRGSRSIPTKPYMLQVRRR
jgi:hypothetical protein